MGNYPETIKELQKELLEHAKDGRSDALFRAAIAMDQFGSLVRHTTHDRELNPTSRPHSSKQGEISDAGHAMVQLMTYCALREIDLQTAINTALDNLRTQDFIAREAKKSGVCKGITASIPRASGNELTCAPVFLDPMCENLGKITSRVILVASHPQSDIGKYSKLLAGVVTDHGGMSCHAAIVCREREIPCIVGTGNATKLFKDGDWVKMTTDGVVEKCTP